MSAPNQALQQTGHANNVCARHNANFRVSRLLSLVFGLAGSDGSLRKLGRDCGRGLQRVRVCGVPPWCLTLVAAVSAGTVTPAWPNPCKGDHPRVGYHAEFSGGHAKPNQSLQQTGAPPCAAQPQASAGAPVAELRVRPKRARSG